MSERVFPAKYNVYELTGSPVFSEWEKGKAMKEKFYRNQKIYKILRYTLIVVIFGLLYLAFKFFSAGGGITNGGNTLIVAFGCYVAYKVVKTKSNSDIDKYNSALYEHARMIAGDAGQKLMRGTWTQMNEYEESLLYNNERFVYVNAFKDIAVAYNTSDIKEVRLERVLRGSSTSGSSSTAGAAYSIGNTGIAVGSASTDSNSETTNHYELHFDIYTGFTQYPKISLVMPDTASDEERLGKAYAVLRP